MGGGGVGWGVGGGGGGRVGVFDIFFASNLFLLC